MKEKERKKYPVSTRRLENKLTKNKTKVIYDESRRKENKK